MKNRILSPDQQGFTLIEIIVSLSIFAVVMTMSTGSLLALIASNRNYQEEQSVMTNLTFVLDAMAREIRTGYGYVCAGTYAEDLAVEETGNGGDFGKIFKPGDSSHEALGGRIKDCNSTGDNNKPLRGISFIEGGDSITGAGKNRIMYYFDDDETNTIMRRVGNDNPQRMLSEGLVVEDFNLFVTGTATTSDIVQPSVTMIIRAVEVNNPDKRYELQTTVTQQVLDL